MELEEKDGGDCLAQFFLFGCTQSSMRFLYGVTLDHSHDDDHTEDAGQEIGTPRQRRIGSTTKTPTVESSILHEKHEELRMSA